MPKPKAKKKQAAKAEVNNTEENHHPDTNHEVPIDQADPTAQPPVLMPIHNNVQREGLEPTEDHEHDDIAEESQKNARKIKEKKHDAGAADLERITDFAQETEISASDISAVMGLIGEEEAGWLAKEEERKELLKVKIRKEDVELLVREFEISKAKAEDHLRQHAGNIMDTLQTLTT